VQNVPFPGAIPGVLLIRSQVNIPVSLLGFRTATLGVPNGESGFQKRHRRRATGSQPQGNSRLICHFRAGIIRHFSPVFTPRDRKVLHRSVPDHRGFNGVSALSVTFLTKGGLSTNNTLSHRSDLNLRDHRGFNGVSASFCQDLAGIDGIQQ